MKTAIFVLALTISTVTTAAARDDDDGRIVNGFVLPLKNAPFMVRVLLFSGTSCGGSLIAPSYVLTAAHCVYKTNLNLITVAANVTTTYERGVRRRVINMTVHPEYDPKTFHSDIAVLRLHYPLEYIKPIELCQRPLEEGDKLLVIGWGNIAKDHKSTMLRAVRVPVRSQKVCEREYPGFTKNMFCASGLDSVGTCQGDSGGPAVIRGQVCGIIAYGSYCGRKGSPNGLTDVYKMRDFINNFIAANEQ